MGDPRRQRRARRGEFGDYVTKTFQLIDPPSERQHVETQVLERVFVDAERLALLEVIDPGLKTRQRFAMLAQGLTDLVPAQNYRPDSNSLLSSRTGRGNF